MPRNKELFSGNFWYYNHLFFRKKTVSKLGMSVKGNYHTFTLPTCTFTLTGRRSIV